MFFSTLNTTQYAKADPDPTVYIGGKVQRTLRKIKNNLKFFFYKVYWTGSLTGKFYGTTKLHNILRHETIDQLPFRLIKSNIEMITYNLDRYLAQLQNNLLSCNILLPTVSHLQKTSRKWYHLM